MAHRVDYARVYDRDHDRSSRDRGAAVLVDRVWPRGVRKADAGFDEWLRAVAPSTELRTWYGHDPERFAEFRRRYLDELDDAERAEALAHLRRLADDGAVTLLTATRDVDHSHAAVLAEVLNSAEPS
ncbi:DUF488 domain-containing protein [Prauserella rugosa]|uniref:Uncharacterized protein YeaO (DUF488 family) n=1 Tax=Prauserella rugosa TaxID=43354 RepID=A0A660C7Y7_9PSEU|nr:DUF488 family protein [Prauserella rugosa]KMS92262.1 hypothetical protein ACZ91_05055 [Streptomyces regensis]TWH19456.1 uncharacterized protein YeaO (DUF488 family) [Prauserella rugosa]